MSSRNFDREVNGPELDNKLIRCVRENPAIYDVNHPHYRRNPVRIAIWERIASELNASSKFLQTKWKNIRYNYLQEQKCLETGILNANVRKRRFTEDLSFLQNTAQSYNVKKSSPKKFNSYTSSDTESNSYKYLFADTNHTTNANDVIEIDHSNDSFEHEDEDEQQEEPAAKKLFNNKLEQETHHDDVTPLSMVQNQRPKSMQQMLNGNKSPENSFNLDDDRSSPLLTPLVVMDDCERNSLTNITNGHSHIDTLEKRKSLSAAYLPIDSCHDSIELYCLSLVDSLRNMSRSERERVKFEFAKILKDAKYKDQS